MLGRSALAAQASRGCLHLSPWILGSRRLRSGSTHPITNIASVTMAAAATPIVLFGVSAAVGAPVIEGLKPEYEVIHFFNEVAQGKADLPRLLASQPHQQPSALGLGSGNYARPPEGVVLGKGFANEDVDEIRAAARTAAAAAAAAAKAADTDTDTGTSTASSEDSAVGIPWVAGGLPATEVAKLTSGQIPMPPREEYAVLAAAKIKETFARVREEGKWRVDGVWFWHL